MKTYCLLFLQLNVIFINFFLNYVFNVLVLCKRVSRFITVVFNVTRWIFMQYMYIHYHILSCWYNYFQICISVPLVENFLLSELFTKGYLLPWAGHFLLQKPGENLVQQFLCAAVYDTVWPLQKSLSIITLTGYLERLVYSLNRLWFFVYNKFKM